MKKSLSIILAIALVFSMFGSVAMAAEKTPMEKFEALKALGVFTGYPDGTAGLDKEMIRAEFAVVIARATGLEPLSGQTYSDVDANDIQKYDWAAGLIEAVSKEGYFEGYNGKFSPGANVTVEQMLAVITRVLGLDTTDVTPVEGATEEDWAYGAINAAVKAGIIAEQEDYTVDATREQLVVSSFAAVEILEGAKQNLSITDLKATGAKQLTVSFNKAVDTDKVTVSVNRGAATVALASTDGSVWSSDKRTLTLNTDSKLLEGTYSVSIKSDSVQIGTASKEVTVTNERIAKIDFVAASETVAKFDKNVIEFKAVNQYGEQSELAANRFQIITSATLGAIVPNAEKQQFTFNTQNLDKGSRVNITIIAPNGEAQANKLFTVGDEPSASKIELGELKLAEGKERLTAGDEATIPVKIYDQYGNLLTDKDKVNNSITKISTNTTVLEIVEIDDNSNLVLKAQNATIDTDVTITLIAHGSSESKSKVIKVYAAKAPHNVAFDSFSDVIAEGDDYKYLTLIAEDQFGNKLSLDEIASAAAANPAKIQVYTTNSAVISDATIMTSGEHKGKVRIKAGMKGNAQVVAYVTTNGNSQNTTVTVQDKRVPQTLTITAQPAGKLLPRATSEIKFEVRDQYGKKFEGDFANHKVNFALAKTSGDDNAVAFPTGDVAEGNVGGINGVGFNFTADATKSGAARLTAKLVKTEVINGNPVEQTLSTATVNVETIKASAADSLTYEVAEVGSLFKTTNEKYAKTVKATAKDSSGVTVALPSDAIKSVASSNSNVTVNGTKVQGVAKGEAIITVQLQPVVGNVKVASQTVTVSEVNPVAESISMAGSKSVENNSINGKVAWDITGDIVLKDSYGVEYKNAALQTDKEFHKAKFVITNVVWNGTAGSLSIDEDTGVLSKSGGTLESFTIMVISNTNGKTASTNVSVY